MMRGTTAMVFRLYLSASAPPSSAKIVPTTKVAKLAVIAQLWL